MPTNRKSRHLPNRFVAEGDRWWEQYEHHMSDKEAKTFVGVLIAKHITEQVDHFVCVLPKVYASEIDWADGGYLLDLMKLTLKTVKEYGSRLDPKNQYASLFRDGAVGPVSAKQSLIPLMIELVRDWLQFGYWKPSVREFRSASSGNIDWQRTVNQKYTVITQQAAWYPEVVVRISKTRHDTLIEQIHTWIVSQCLLQVGQLFFSGLSGRHTQIPQPASLGEMIVLLQRQRQQVYSQRESRLFSFMIRFLKMEKDSKKSTKYIYGTNLFWRIYEVMLQHTLNDKKEAFTYLHASPLWEETTSGQTWREDGQSADIIVPLTITESGMVTSTKRIDDDAILLLDAKYRDVYRYFDQKMSKVQRQYSMLSYTDIRKQYFYGLILLARHPDKGSQNPETIPVHNALVFPISDQFCGRSTESENFSDIEEGFQLVGNVWLNETEDRNKPSISILVVNLAWLMREYIADKHTGRHAAYYPELWNATRTSEFDDISQIF